MDEVLPCSFKIRLQNPSGKSLEGRDVHCVVVEEGSWTMPDGRKIEAKTYESKLTDHKSSWVGEEQTYTNSYSNPVVLGQVISYNDAKWSVFWSGGSSSNRAPSALAAIGGVFPICYLTAIFGQFLLSDLWRRISSKSNGRYSKKALATVKNSWFSNIASLSLPI